MEPYQTQTMAKSSQIKPVLCLEKRLGEPSRRKHDLLTHIISIISPLSSVTRSKAQRSSKLIWWYLILWWNCHSETFSLQSSGTGSINLFEIAHCNPTYLLHLKKYKKACVNLSLCVTFGYPCSMLSSFMTPGPTSASPAAVSTDSAATERSDRAACKWIGFFSWPNSKLEMSWWPICKCCNIIMNLNHIKIWQFCD